MPYTKLRKRNAVELVLYVIYYKGIHYTFDAKKFSFQNLPLGKN